MGCDYYTPTHAYLISIRLCFTYAVREFHFHINNTALDQQLTQSAGCLLRASLAYSTRLEVLLLPRRSKVH